MKNPENVVQEIKTQTSAAAMIGQRSPAAMGQIIINILSNHVPEAACKKLIDSAIALHDQEKPPVFELNGKAVDLRNAVPMTVGDFKALKKSGVDIMKLSTGEISMEGLIAVVSHVCKKANPELTTDDFDSMPGSWFMRIGTVVNKLGEQIDVPF